MAVIQLHLRQEKKKIKINRTAGKVITMKDAAKVEKKDPNTTWDFFAQLGFIDGNKILERNYSGVDGIWKDQPAYIIGAGPSLEYTLPEVGGWKFFDGKHTIGINHVIEDYDGLEWFFFLDRRFTATSSYDLRNFKGMIFAKCVTGMKPAEKVKIFSSSLRVSSKFEEGLYGTLSGVAALNLAILTGANPIYLFGMDAGKGGLTTARLHYKRGYTGEIVKPRVLEKYKRIMTKYDHFKPFANRLRLVTNGGNELPWIKRTNAHELVTGKIQIKKPYSDMKIVHLSFSQYLNRHADITRWVCQKCIGKHEIIDCRTETIPDADLYIVEHFLSTQKVVNELPDVIKRKSICIVHTEGCLPTGDWGRMIALTNAWKAILEKNLIKVDRVISPGIDLETYKGIEPDYSKKVIGRITRWNAQKIHPQFNEIVSDIINKHEDAQALFYVSYVDKAQREYIKHERIKYSEECKIHMDKGQFLKNLSIYVHANANFKETFSFAVVEAMATGLPIIYLDEGTGVLQEVTGSAGIACKTIGEVKQRIIELLEDQKKREIYGRLAKVQAMKYDIRKTVEAFDGLIKRLYEKLFA